MNKTYPILLPLLVMWMALACQQAQAQTDTVVYHLTINQEKVTIAGKSSMGMTINGTIPGPTLRFTEGDYAVMYVKNEMDVETSVHWHGLLVPNFYDGVPYLTTPPIKPGQVQKYEFPLKQGGTYWYHSHSGLQEQSGVYGSIVIEDKQEQLDYDTDLVLVLSDWTYEKPKNVLKTLKRGLEIYDIQKGTSTPLSMVIGRGALGAQLNFWRQRMEGADIADIYYPAFLTNGKPVQEYPAFRPGQKVRLRVINASASSQYWLTFGGATPLLIAADGQDVVPVHHSPTFIAVAETYDFVVTIPEHGKLEMKATAQDGSGHTSAFLGEGPVVAAPDVPRPDKIAIMQRMAAMDMRMGAPAIQFSPSQVDPTEMMNEWGMQMDDMVGMDGMEHGGQMKMPPVKNEMMKAARQDTSAATGMDAARMNHPMGEVRQGSSAAPAVDHAKMEHHLEKKEMGKMHPEMNMPRDSASAVNQPNRNHPMPGHDGKQMDMSGMKGDSALLSSAMPGMNMFDEYNYDYLKSPVPTDFAEDKPVREILLNLTGNMVRYIWSMNGVPLKEADKIKIKQGEVTRITLNNLTMMHHPMHLHGHFFRVINEHGVYSPLKHTVNVAPMQKIVIEFDANEYGDWFFHCHILYHLDAGMARVFSYDTPRDPRLKRYPLNILTNKSNHYFFWGAADAASHMGETRMVLANLRNQFTLSAEYGWNKNLEAELTYQRYLYDYLSVFGGVNVENEGKDNLQEIQTTAIAGIRYFTPYMFNLDVRIDSKLRPQVSLSREVLIFPRTFLFGEYEYQADFGWGSGRTAEEMAAGADVFRKEVTWSTGLEYMLSKSFSLMGSYDNRFGAGGGVTVRF